MLQLPTEGEFKTLEPLWQHVYNVARAQGYAVSTLRSNIAPNQMEIGCDRSGTPNSNKNPSKTVTSTKLDCPFRLDARKYAKSTTWTLQVKNPEHSHDATENIMAHPAFRKFNEQETSQISQMSESLLLPRQIQAQLCSKRDSDRPVILQDIYNQVKKIKKDKLKGRRPIDSLIDTLKEENFVWSSARGSEGHITSLFLTHPLAIKLLHGPLLSPIYCLNPTSVSFFIKHVALLYLKIIKLQTRKKTLIVPSLVVQPKEFPQFMDFWLFIFQIEPLILKKNAGNS
ncbi:hypothetical protein O181_005269 [Austropuccinia psidii MF-1]|uniref:MULE transposase domain-containing protein n=1 Tax=Austropuccinia psidii MF-1 TaxID=1389203 RepID=A0A9Q3BH61_9BASI|nr:hypothetical protein [Austropuccinia psidii MF-1]